MTHRPKISREISTSCDTSLNNPAIIAGVTTTTNDNIGGRAIDRHEDAILAVLSDCDEGGQDLLDAVEYESGPFGISAERLLHLVRVWCAVAGVEVPA
jgi:hypothetical protein